MTNPGEWAPLVVAIATLITALAGAVAVVYNAIRAKRMEGKLDAAEVVRTQIHKAVNGDRDRDRARIVELEAEVARLRSLQAPISDH